MRNKYEKEFYSVMREYLISLKVIDYDASYWLAVAKGILLLYEFKGKVDKEKFKLIYESVRVEIVSMSLSNVVHDIADDVSAIVIGYYSKPDFWNCELADFESDRFFKQYFDIVKNSGSVPN